MNNPLRVSAKRFLCVAGFLLFLGTGAALAQTTSFTYQGRLTDGGTPPTGTYDMQFKLFDAVTAGSPQGSPNTVTNSAVNVIRKDLAMGYLSEPGMAVCEAAYLLGFSESSALHRAFKRWTGVTPNEFMDKQRY
jgi:AraC-like DNA-binding protein